VNTQINESLFIQQHRAADLMVWMLPLVRQ